MAAFTPAFKIPVPGNLIALPQVPAQATARAAGSAVTGSGAVHHTAAAPARTIMTRRRRIGSPRHIPAGPERSAGRPVRHHYPDRYASPPGIARAQDW